MITLIHKFQNFIETSTELIWYNYVVELWFSHEYCRRHCNLIPELFQAFIPEVIHALSLYILFVSRKILTVTIYRLSVL